MRVRHILGISGETDTTKILHSHTNELAHSQKFPFFNHSTWVLQSLLDKTDYAAS